MKELIGALCIAKHDVDIIRLIIGAEIITKQLPPTMLKLDYLARSGEMISENMYMFHYSASRLLHQHYNITLIDGSASSYPRV